EKQVVPAAIVVNDVSAELIVTIDSSPPLTAELAPLEGPPHNFEIDSCGANMQMTQSYTVRWRTAPPFLTTSDVLARARYTVVAPGKDTSGLRRFPANLTDSGYVFQSLPGWKSARQQWGRVDAFDTSLRELGSRTQLVEQEQQQMRTDIERTQSSLAIAEATLPPRDIAALAVWDRPPDPHLYSIGAPSAIEPAEVRRSVEPWITAAGVSLSDVEFI
ncbi:unnamed protein product, partial [Prorocentrum cordatum]